MMYKKKYTFLLFFVLILCTVALSGCSTNKMDLYNKTQGIDLSKEKIDTISLGSKENEVKSKFGKPDSIKEDKGTNSTYLTYKDKENGFLQFKIVKGIVEQYLLSGKEYKTEKDISKASTREDVIKAYGKHYYERTDSGVNGNVLGYFDKRNKTNIEFSSDENKKIVGILIENISEQTK